jgi:glucosamine--fructose-6-phosphate aminotransferase (isomerizing)
MSDKVVRESTLSFRYEPRAYEEAAKMPLYYRSMNLEPRWQHPFWVYDAILAQGKLVGESLALASRPAAEMVLAFLAQGKKRFLFSGVGASYHLGAMAALLFGELTGLPSEFVESSEALQSGIPYDYPDTMVVGLSASGNTVEVIEHIRQAKAGGALVVGFTNLDNTRLVSYSHLSCVSAGGYGVVWDVTTRLAALAYLAVELATKMGRPLDQLESFRYGLFDLPLQMDQTVQQIEGACRRIGQRLRSLRAAVIPAAGNLLPVALEAALRFEEMAHMPARGRPLVDFLHGGVGYLAEDIACMILAAPGSSYEYSRRVANVTRELKTPAFAIVEETDEELPGLVDEAIRIPASHPSLRPFLYVLPMQMIPYFVEVARPGGNPDVQRTDQPRYARAFDIAYPPGSH